SGRRAGSRPAALSCLEGCGRAVWSGSRGCLSGTRPPPPFRLRPGPGQGLPAAGGPVGLLALAGDQLRHEYLPEMLADLVGGLVADGLQLVVEGPVVLLQQRRLPADGP